MRGSRSSRHNNQPHQFRVKPYRNLISAKQILEQVEPERKQTRVSLGKRETYRGDSPESKRKEET
jgi:hypothetical protein